MCIRDRSYGTVLEKAKETDVECFCKSNLPSEFFNDSFLAYNTSDLFFRTLYDATSKYFKRYVIPVKDNQTKFRNAVSVFERHNRPLVTSYITMLEYNTKLRLLVAAWNAKDDPEKIFKLDYLDFNKVNGKIYSDLYKKFFYNLRYLRNELLNKSPQECPVVFDEHEPITAVWRELMQTIVR